jgi:hypothetical protein
MSLHGAKTQKNNIIRLLLSLILEARRLSLDLLVNEILVLDLLIITQNKFVWYI